MGTSCPPTIGGQDVYTMPSDTQAYQAQPAMTCGAAVPGNPPRRAVQEEACNEQYYGNGAPDPA